MSDSVDTPEEWNAGGGPTDKAADPQPMDIDPSTVPEGFEYHG
jgi:hypothetical protein